MNGPALTDGKTRFSSRVADYVAGRPPYPRAVLGTLAERIGFDRTWRVADVGAGTGISTRLFVENGNPTVAIEPNEAMRGACVASLSSHANFSAIAAPAEATTLTEASVDLVVAAQAFHWFDPAGFARECNRILTPRGRVLLMWNDRSIDDPFMARYEQIVERYASDYTKVGHRKRDNQDSTAAWFDPASYAFVEVPNIQPVDLETLKARTASSSYMPQRDDPGFAPMMDEITRLFAEFAIDGKVAMPHVTRMNIGRPMIEKDNA